MRKIIGLLFLLGFGANIYAQQWLGSNDGNGKIYRTDKIKVGTGPLYLDWTYQSNWGGNSDKWSGYIGFNAFRNNDDLKDKYFGENQYTSKLVFEGSNAGFRWLYRAPVNNDSHVQHTLTELMVLSSDGKLGIGTTAPLSRLSIFNGAGAGKNTDGLDGSLLYLNNGTLPDGSIVIKSHGVNQVIGALKFHSSPDYSNFSQAAIKALAGPYAEASALAFYTSNSNTQQVGSEVMRIQGANVGIGTTTPDAKLAVKGTIHAQEVKVDLLGAVAPDYVFEPTYKLTPLSEVENYIKQHKHLPEVPSAKEMEEQGVNLKEMNMLLLKKVEELTLHVIELKKEVNELKKNN